MKQKYHLVTVAAISAGLLLSACSQSAQVAAPKTSNGSAIVEHLAGSVDVTKVKLTQDAAKRLDLQTAVVRAMAVNGAQRMVIPYASILYDVTGATWTYTNPEPLVYVRHSVNVDLIKGNDAILKEDLPSGTAVVTVGAAELYGSETEFEEE